MYLKQMTLAPSEMSTIDARFPAQDDAFEQMIKELEMNNKEGKVNYN